MALSKEAKNYYQQKKRRFMERNGLNSKEEFGEDIYNETRKETDQLIAYIEGVNGLGEEVDYNTLSEENKKYIDGLEEGVFKKIGIPRSLLEEICAKNKIRRKYVA